MYTKNILLLGLVFYFCCSILCQSVPSPSPPQEPALSPTQPLLPLPPISTPSQNLPDRVEQLEKQVRMLTAEVVELRKVLAVQHQMTEKISQSTGNTPYRYDELIAQLEKEAPQNRLLSFYHQLIHAQAWIGGYLDVQVQQEESDWELGDSSIVAIQWRTSWNETFAMQGELALTQDEVKISHAYFTTTLQSWLAFKTGILRVPFGRYNLNSTPPSLDFASIPLSHQYTIPQVWSAPGISVFGQMNSGVLSYELMLSSGLDESRFDPTTGNHDAGWELDHTSWNTSQISGRIEFVPPWKLDTFAFSTGISGIVGFEHHDEGYWGMAVDVFLQLGPFTAIGDHDRIIFQGEWMMMESFSSSPNPSALTQMDGYYGQASYSFFLESWREAASFFTPETALGAMIRYELLDSKQSLHINNLRHYTMGIFFRVFEPTVLRLEYSRSLDDADWDRWLASFATFF